jgi:hypothetical protein
MNFKSHKPLQHDSDAKECYLYSKLNTEEKKVLLQNVASRYVNVT